MLGILCKNHRENYSARNTETEYEKSHFDYKVLIRDTVWSHKLTDKRREDVKIQDHSTSADCCKNIALIAHTKFNLSHHTKLFTHRSMRQNTVTSLLIECFIVLFSLRFYRENWYARFLSESH